MADRTVGRGGRAPKLILSPLEDRVGPSESLSYLFGLGLHDLLPAGGPLPAWSDDQAAETSTVRRLDRWLEFEESSAATVDVTGQPRTEEQPAKRPTVFDDLNLAEPGLDLDDWLAAPGVGTVIRVTAGGSTPRPVSSEPTPLAGPSSSGDSVPWHGVNVASADGPGEAVTQTDLPMVARPSTDKADEPLRPGEERLMWKGQTITAVSGEWLVQLDGLNGAPDEQMAATQGRLARADLGGVAVVDHLGADGLFLVRVGGLRGAERVVSSLSRVEGYAFAEPNAVSHLAAVPNDTYYSSQWGLNSASDHDIDAPEAWDVTTGSAAVTVAVLDSGIDYSIPDLAGRVNTANDYDFVNNDADAMDDNGHGTEVAGVIGAVGNNGTGVAGVAWNVSLLPVKVTNASGGVNVATEIQGINYLVSLKTSNTVNVRVINASLAGLGYVQAESDAIANARNAGILFVAAAGNGDKGVGPGQNNDDPAHTNYPASYALDNIISVAATDQNDNLAWFSNYGATSVDLAAPGVSIRTTSKGPGPTYGYPYVDGTSLAAPMVAGVAALAFSADPTATYQEVRQAILAGADRLSSLQGLTATGGRLNAARAIRAIVHDNTFLTGDMNNDGISDLVVVGADGATAQWYWATNNGTGALVSGVGPVPFGATGPNIHYLTGDMNNLGPSGASDLVMVVASGPTAQWYWAVNNGAGGLVSAVGPVPFGATGPNIHYLTGDMNGDGISDPVMVVASGPTAQWYWAVNNGAGGLGALTGPVPFGATVTNLHYLTADMNGDGISDLVMVEANGPAAQWYWAVNNGAGGLVSAVGPVPFGGTAGDVRFLTGDMNDPGHGGPADVVAVDANGAAAQWYWAVNNGAGGLVSGVGPVPFGATG